MNPFLIWFAPENTTEWVFDRNTYLRRLMPHSAQDLPLHDRHFAWAVYEVCNAMVRTASLFKGLCTHFLELWLVLRDAIRQPAQISGGWTNWLKVCERELQRPFTLHSIKLGHRLLTHTSRVMSHTQNMSASQELRDPFTAAMRRVWPSNHHAAKLRDSLQKLCRDNPNEKARDAIRVELQRVVLAYRMGWITGHRLTRTCGDHHRALEEFRDPSRAQWNPADSLLVADALQAYLAWYMQNCFMLRDFAQVHLPGWPAACATFLRAPSMQPAPTIPTSGLWLPEYSFGFLVRHVVSDHDLREGLLGKSKDEDGPSESYEQDLKQHAASVFEARQQLTLQQTENITPAALDCAVWMSLGEHLLLRPSTVTFFINTTRAHYRRENVKTRFREWVEQLLAQRQTTFRDIAALRAIFQVCRERQTVYTAPVPYLWAHTTASAFEDRETIAGVSISPMCDVFMYCPECLRVCSFCAPPIGSPLDPDDDRGRNTRRRRKASRARVSASASSQTTVAGEPIFSAGFRFVVIDVDTNRYMCASRKTGSMQERCRDSELRQLHLTGKLLVFHGRVFLLCPQPRCARMMEFEPGVCKFNEYGPCCSVCSSLKNVVLPPLPPTPAQIAADRERAARLDASIERLLERVNARARVISFDEDENEDTS